MPCRCVLEQGAVLERLAHHSNACDLLIAGTRGETEALYPGHGGTLERLVKRLRVSALLVPRGGLALRGLALGYDGSEGSRVALRVAGHLASWLEVPVHVVFARERRRAAASVDDALEHLREAGVTVTHSELTGEPAEVLPAAMADAEIDTLVVGFRGRTGLADRFLGRVTERLLHDPELGLLIAR